ncbi:hypothetical protein PN497_19820 [Sphaerospermopsis kisseleviana CS-549]|uniref:Uncharacterized protein n=1 Tax=Sphaerospermopsis kisseleviana CS-549 TaxID=3021783 RepID=A0ABT4ZWD9_9CYAN|nr:hypothetical protein [Sphaerospermopsis kisseleviana]MDB9443584.1 hypothetical protein [Sphaerospermopsis kisseleviana CS-549]
MAQFYFPIASSVNIDRVAKYQKSDRSPQPTHQKSDRTSTTHTPEKRKSDRTHNPTQS